METDYSKDSDDEQAAQDDREDEVENMAEEPQMTEQPTSSESRQENQANESRKSSKRSRIKSSAATSKGKANAASQPASKRTLKSANAFINFVQDFKKDHPDMVIGRNIFQICSERWKSMSEEQKQPYIAAANTVRRLKQRRIGENGEQFVKKTANRISKRKAENKRKETSQKRSKVIYPGTKSCSDADTPMPMQSSLSDADFS